jgi:hypothetical protein
MARFVIDSLIGCPGQLKKPEFRTLQGGHGREDYGFFRTTPAT